MKKENLTQKFFQKKMYVVQKIIFFFHIILVNAFFGKKNMFKYPKLSLSIKIITK